MAQLVKNPPAMQETLVQSLGWEGILPPGEGKGYPLQYSVLENSMDCTVHGVSKSQTLLRDLHFISLLWVYPGVGLGRGGQFRCFPHPSGGIACRGMHSTCFCSQHNFCSWLFINGIWVYFLVYFDPDLLQLCMHTVIFSSI